MPKYVKKAKLAAICMMGRCEELNYACGKDIF